MIIFDLETLADDSHRRHFVDPLASRPGGEDYALSLYSPDLNMEYFHRYADGKRGFFYRDTHKRWEPDYQAFYEACDQDKPIKPVIDIFYQMQDVFHLDRIQIWSGRCESVRKKTITWLMKHAHYDEDIQLKMRPIGDDRPGHLLKKEWLDKYMFNENCKFPTLKHAVPINTVQKVFSSDPESIKMYRKHGIFVFDCRQS